MNHHTSTPIQFNEEVRTCDGHIGIVTGIHIPEHGPKLYIVRTDSGVARYDELELAAA